MLKKNLFRSICMLALVVVSCTKNVDDKPVEKVSALSSEKQLLNINFATQSYTEQADVSKENSSLTPKKALTSVVTNPIEIDVLKKAAPFIAVYGTVDGTNTDAKNMKMEFSGSQDGVNWSNWIEAKANEDATESLGKFVFSGVELENKSNYIKIKVNFITDQSVLKNANIYVYNPTVTSTEEQTKINAYAEKVNGEMLSMRGEVSNKAAAQDLTAKPIFTSRDTWGAKSPKSTASLTTVNFLIVHHEEGSNSSNDWAARVRAIQNLHMDVNGWADIGYNYIVDPNGVPYEGRAGGENVVGAHLCGKNTNTMGVCMLGSFTSQLPTNNALYTLKRIIAWKSKQRNIDPTAKGFHVDRTIFKFSGHRSSCATDCPGTKLFNQLDAIRSDIKTNFLKK